MFWLFIYVCAISLYDLHEQRIPNWYSLPLLLAGLIARFPGNIDLWIGSGLLVSAWILDWMGGGDVKLWLALLWALPNETSTIALHLMLVALAITGLAQIVWRLTSKKPPTGLATPGAWRTIPFVLACWYVH